ncbi:MAG TPA: glucuronate isomerase, partial [Flavilitoribacter sp.]|nr:glucuronate isomerase [Flavilitoribacter sp.]
MSKEIKPFIDDNFLLENRTAEILYHEYAKVQPIIDYHCHLPPDEIAADKQFPNLTAIWLYGDHYKWRAMRTLGVPERYITGNATDAEKFAKWAETVPYTLRNPLFHWTHLELKRYFGVHDILNPASASAVYEQCSALLNTPGYSTRNILRKMNVSVVCTTDDPTDNLEYHRQIGADGFEVKILPAFRPDKAILIEREGFNGYIEKLGEVAGVEIKNLADLLESIRKRADFFDQNGCKLSDHGLEQVYAEPFTDKEADEILRKKLSGAAVTAGEARKLMSAILYPLGCLYREKGWT